MSQTAFSVDVSLLAPGYGIHFDLYNEVIKSRSGVTYDIDVNNFAPFSHDAAGYRHEVSDAANTFAMLGLAMIGLGFAARRRR